MKITLKTNQSNTAATLEDLQKIVSFALLQCDIALEVESYGTFNDTQLAALNNIYLQETIKEQGKS